MMATTMMMVMMAVNERGGSEGYNDDDHGVGVGVGEGDGVASE